MRQQIIESTLLALSAITNPRLFNNERGYAAEFKSVIEPLLAARGLMEKPGALVEVEHQKYQSKHGMVQRPDAIFHVPVEVSGASVKDDNYAVWAFKRRADIDDAWEDFRKLDEMFDTLKYPLGFSVNIGGAEDFLEFYPGPYRDRLFGVCVLLKGGVANCLIRPATDVPFRQRE